MHVQQHTRPGTSYDMPCLSQRDLDSRASEIAQRQDESDASRKKLIELSREFKKTASEVQVVMQTDFPLG